MKQKRKILVIDDEPTVCRSCEKILKSADCEVISTLNPREGIEKAVSGGFDLVITDVKMPEVSGMDILRIVREKAPWVCAIIITGYSSIQSAVEAIKEGAFDYVPKPFTPDELSIVVERAFETKILKEENKFLRGEIEGKYKLDNMVGGSRVMQSVFKLVKMVAPMDSTVLVYGESGTGKELIARAIHFNGNTGREKFVAVDCNTLADGLFESEIFGHEKGAFTGAVKQRKGLLEEASGGTLFLDEISNLNLDMQAKLLRALEAREVKPVGGDSVKQVDFRLICATNRDLVQMIERGEFREDLFYRINVFPINLPPLRGRPEDIPPLVSYFLKQFATRMAKRIEGIEADAMGLLTAYDWPGNIRELKNVMERLVIMASGSVIMRPAVAGVLGGGAARDNPADIPKTSDELKELKKQAREQAVVDLEKNFVLSALKNAGWNITRAARDTGMQRQNFQSLVRKYRIRHEEEEEIAQ